MFNYLRKKAGLLLAAGLFVSLPFAGLAQGSLKETARVAKVTPDLLQAVQRLQAAQAIPGKRTMGVNGTAGTAEEGVQLEIVDMTDTKDGLIAIEAVADDEGGQNLLNDLRALGLSEANQYQRIIYGYLPVNKVASLKDVKGLRFARPAYKPIHNAGRVTSQGDRAMRSDMARRTYNVTGAGSKVGVISDSYDYLDRASLGVDSDDLPRGVKVLDESYRVGNEDEGRAMAEIIHDVAPGAAIAFNTANKGQSGFANGILNLAKIGCNVIVDDVIYFAEPFFQDGIIAQAVNEVVQKQGVSYFSSAGNSARASFQTAFVNSGKAAPRLTLADGVAHAFPDGTSLQSVTIAGGGGSFFGIYQWDDAFYSVSGKSGNNGARTDLDIFVYLNGQLFTSSAADNIGKDPFEAVQLTNRGSTPVVIQIAIVKYAGPDPNLVKFVNFGSGSRVQFATNSSTLYGHANAGSAIAVGAAYFANTPVFNPNLAAPVLENFSSAGGTPIYFTTDGRRVAPVTRQKPEIVAPDGASTTFFFRLQGDVNGDGFPDFFGTSAAAPHAAAVAALMQEKSGNKLSPSMILTNLIGSAIDMDDPATTGFDRGFDFGTGNGLIQADKALAAGEPFAILTPLFDCNTNTITFRATAGNGSPVEFFVPGVTVYTTRTTFVLEDGIVRDANNTTLDIYARQNGVVVTSKFNFRQACVSPVTPPVTTPVTPPGPTLPAGAFKILPPVFNCQNGQLTILTTAGDGTRIEVRAFGATDWTTNPVTVLEPGVFNDLNTTNVQIQARQSGKLDVYDFNFRRYCQLQAAASVGTGRSTATAYADERVAPATEDVAGELQVTVQQNPVTGNWAEVRVLGVGQQSLTLRVAGMRGVKVSEQVFETAVQGNRYRVPLGQSAGLYLLQVTTPTQTKTVKILRQ
jgi:Subtilase family